MDAAVEPSFEAFKVQGSLQTIALSNLQAKSPLFQLALTILLDSAYLSFRYIRGDNSTISSIIFLRWNDTVRFYEGTSAVHKLTPGNHQALYSSVKISW